MSTDSFQPVSPQMGTQVVRASTSCKGTNVQMDKQGSERHVLLQLVIKKKSCCVIWWQRRRQTNNAARMLSEDGGPSCNGHEKSAGYGTGCSTSRENEGEHIRNNDRRSGSHGHSHCSSAGGSARDWMHSSGGLLGTSEQSPRQRDEKVDGHCRSGENS